MPNLRKMQIAIHFYGKIGHLCGVITQKWPCDGPRWFKLKKDVKMSKRCQNVKKSNTQTMEEVHKKNKLT